MNIDELHSIIQEKENRLNQLMHQHKNYVEFSKRGFAFTDNWRDKESIIKHIPIIAKQIVSLKEELNVLKTERDSILKAIEEHNFLEAKKAKEEEASRIKNPISILEIE